MAKINLLVHLLFPHASNNHRAKALHIDSLLVYVLLFAVFNLTINILHRQIPDVLGYATDIHVQQLLDGTNAMRVAAGLPPLTLNNTLSQAAAGKASDMLAKNYWAHNSPTGTTPWDFIVGAGYRYTVAGENLAKNFSDSNSVVSAWMDSSTHRANIIKPSYQEVGFAVVNGKLNGEETTLVVQMFGARSIAQVPTTTPTAMPKPVEVAAPENAPFVEPVRAAAPQQFISVVKTPVVNIPTVSRDIVFAFIGIMMGLLLMDALIAKKNHVSRITGHNIAHMMFLVAMYILFTQVGHGRLL